MSDWAETTLGEVLSVTNRPVKVDALSEVPWAGARWYAGGIYSRLVEPAAKVKTKTLNRLQSGDVTYNRMWATKAAFGVVDAEADGCLVTGDFPIFVADQSRLLPEYMRKIFQTAGFQREASLRAVGTTERRRLKEPDFLSIVVSLPSLAEQRRIVNVMAAVDAQIEALKVEVDGSRKLLTPLAQDVFDELGGETVRLGDAVRIVRGGSPRPIDNYFTTDPDGLNWIKIGDVARGGKYITKTAQKIKPEGLSKTRFVRAGSFLLSNSMSFGRPYILGINGCIHDGWLSLTDERHAFSPDFLYYLLRSRGVQEQFERVAAGSGVRNLNVKSVQGVVVSLPALGEQLKAVKRLNELTAIADAGGDELAALRAFRSALLSSLLSQDVEIPESYDAALAVDWEVAS